MTSHHASESIGLPHVLAEAIRVAQKLPSDSVGARCQSADRSGNRYGDSLADVPEGYGLRGKHDSRTRWVGGRPSIGVGSKGKED